MSQFKNLEHFSKIMSKIQIHEQLFKKHEHFLKIINIFV
jgi:hypothetical protein